MASQTEENYSCPICRDIFRDPVLLSCSHSLCRTCWQQCWTNNPDHRCPVCRTRCWQSDPPRNLALKAVCEDFLAERAQRASAGAEPRCSLHAEKFKLFCLDDQQPVCVVCMHSEIHRNHSVRPIDEAAQDYKCGLQEFLDDLREKLELLNDVNRNFDQTEKDIEVQNTKTESQIKEVFSKLQQFLQREERVRIAALSEEKQWKTQVLKRKIEAVNTEIAALSDTIRVTEEALQAEDLCFLQNYMTTAERVYQPLPDIPKPISRALLNTAKHLNNLTSVVLNKMKEEMVTSNSEVLRSTRTVVLRPRSRYLDTSDYCNTFSNASRNRFSLAREIRTATVLDLTDDEGSEQDIPLRRAVSTQILTAVHRNPEPAPGLLRKKTKSCWSLTGT